MNKTINDILLSLLTGIALLVTVRAGYALSVDYLPDAWLMDGSHPLARLAIARFLLFSALVAILALPLCWPLAEHAKNKIVNTALPGAACALVLYLLLERLQRLDPFPWWLDFACGAVLFVALPLAVQCWWRRMS
ncbi:MAG TPA: hypothetical protein VF275_07145 [Gammaproteobacteria bacterium]